jgi:transcriptional regulator with XRE-family HTH domain
MTAKLPCPLSIQLAHRTEAYRKKHGLSYRALGGMAGMSADQVICFVRGADQGATLTLRTSANLAGAIGCKLELRGR